MMDQGMTKSVLKHYRRTCYCETHNEMMVPAVIADEERTRLTALEYDLSSEKAHRGLVEDDRTARAERVAALESENAALREDNLKLLGAVVEARNWVENCMPDGDSVEPEHEDEVRATWQLHQRWGVVVHAVTGTIDGRRAIDSARKGEADNGED